MRRLSSVLGYLGYVLAVLIFLLWWRFPGDEVAAWCCARLQDRFPAYQWQIDTLQWKFPNRLEIKDIRAVARKAADREPVLHIDDLDLSLDLLSLLRKYRRLTYALHLYDGVGTGRFHLALDHSFSCQGSFTGLRLERMHGLVRAVQRAIKGEAGATFTWKGRWPALRTTDLSGQVRVENGFFPLRKPVLGLRSLSFSRLEANVMYRQQGPEWQIDNGQLAAKTMHVVFTGKVVPGPDLGSSRIDFSGSLTPRAELFKGPGNRDMARIVRGFLRNGALPFTVSGTAAEPSVHFPDRLAAALRRFQPRGGRQ